MAVVLVVGGGLFGSQAAALARRRGLEALVFDAGLEGAASPAAAGLFRESWAGRRWAEHYHAALPILEELYGIESISLLNDAGEKEPFLSVPPRRILEPTPIRETVTAVGDGWLEAGGQRYQGQVYVAAGVWAAQFLPGLEVQGKAGAAFAFQGEREGRIHPLAHARQALAFVRDPGMTYFSDGTAEVEYQDSHERDTLDRAAAMGLTDSPLARIWGRRPYTPKAPVFLKLSPSTWLATGGRKMGTIVGASFASRLIRELGQLG